MIQSSSGASVQRYRASAAFFNELSPFPVFYFNISMVRTRSGSRLRPRVRFSSPEREAPTPVPVPAPSSVPKAVPEEPQGFRRYQTRMGPRAPSPVPRGELGGPDPPSGPAHQAQVSHLPPGPHHLQLLQLPRRLHHLNCRLPRGFGGHCS